MQNYVKKLQDLKREPAKDETCINYSRSLLDSEQTFDYCRADLDIKNKQNLTPLTLAAKLARKEIFQYILEKRHKISF